MTNPVTPFRNALFASRGMDIQSALDYAEMMINTLSAVDQVSVRTAFGVVINTIDSAVTQSQGPSPVEEALFAIIDKRFAKLQINTQVEINSYIDDWMDSNLQDKVSDKLDSWADNDLNERMDSWAEDNLGDSVDDRIESWIDDNLTSKLSELTMEIVCK